VLLRLALMVKLTVPVVTGDAPELTLTLTATICGAALKVRSPKNPTVVVELVAALVSEKVTAVSPVAEALTLYAPGVRLALKGADAIPFAPVVTAMAFVALVSVPLAPDAGAVNVTCTPLTGLAEASSTVTARALANSVSTLADCGVVPATARHAGCCAGCVREREED
jgi:hypothetical protein